MFCKYTWCYDSFYKIQPKEKFNGIFQVTLLLVGLQFY